MAEEIVEKKKAPFSWVRVFSVTGAVLLVLLVVAVVRVQPKLAFNPAPKLIATPAIYDMKFEKVLVETNGLSVAGWLVRASGTSRGTVLYCHSSAGNRSYELDACLFFTKAGFDVLSFDYPGFADSRGDLSERHCYESTRILFDFLTERSAPRPLVVYGRARGAAVAAHLATERPVDALVLEGSYSSWPEQAKDQLGSLRHLILWDFPTEKFLRKGSVPVLFVHSVYDREVPIELGRRVYAAYQGPKQFFETGGLHGEAATVCAPAYQEALIAFLKEIEE